MEALRKGRGKSRGQRPRISLGHIGISPRLESPRPMPILPQAMRFRRLHLRPSHNAPVKLRQKLKRLSNFSILIHDGALEKGWANLHYSGFSLPLRRLQHTCLGAHRKCPRGPFSHDLNLCQLRRQPRNSWLPTIPLARAKTIAPTTSLACIQQGCHMLHNTDEGAIPLRNSTAAPNLVCL